MTSEVWTSVDRYLCDTLLGKDSQMEEVLARSANAGLPPISVTPNQGKMLNLFLRMLNARRVLEIGTLGGYSAVWMARALPEYGKLITLEADPHHAAVARENFQLVGFSDRIELREGIAETSLAEIYEEDPTPFDLIFIDADKPSNPAYFKWALKLSHPGTLIIVDNVVRAGEVIDPVSSDPSVQGVRALNELIRQEKRVSATAMQTVGEKGYDGFALIFVND
ncbi:O-methyltransferase [Telmatocola sphagniphila]|jgi:predicted O-methyltransferase YrrM|uniref:O-methyltransferase n=1 Tax=Telmatocola sphagniphila TaxID=1123043 RepID=A0A8E6B5W8_9BACT|nr:O-methyltransferase [Telmatocola sphagniphila]QVL31937.1 O-methyltransferase [Telmatocola sphagniphila]